MGKGTFRALAAAGLLLPFMALAAVLIHPSGRAFVGAFFAPLPGPKGDAGAVSLPPLSGPRGAESVELRSLREDSSAGSDAVPNVVMRPRLALFGAGPDGEIPPPETRFTRPPGLRRPDMMTRDDALIDRALQHLTSDGRARDAFVDTLKRSGRFDLDLTRILRAWKVPEALIAVAFVESAAQPTVSSDVAAGLWQLTPNVAHVYGLSMLPTYDERRGIATGTEAAAHYLADLRERLGSWELAIAAFGLGYKPVLDALALHGTADFAEVAPSLPRATTLYVAEVMATAILLTNLPQFGLDTVKRAEPASVSDLDVPGGMSLTLVARAAGVSGPTLRELNPEYSGDVVPSTTFPMLVHVPSDTLARARDLLPLVQEGKDVPVSAGDVDGDGDGGALSLRPRASSVVSRGSDKRMLYRVREGDTLPTLAAEHGVPVETIASDNALDSTSSLRPGMILTIRLYDSPRAASGSASAAAPIPRSAHPPPKERNRRR